MQSGFGSKENANWTLLIGGLALLQRSMLIKRSQFQLLKIYLRSVKLFSFIVQDYSRALLSLTSVTLRKNVLHSVNIRWHKNCKYILQWFKNILDKILCY